MTVARRKGIDGARRRHSGDVVAAQLRVMIQTHAEFAETADDAAIPDRRLALLFACAHPAIDVAVRAPLMLQTVLGLDAKAIASAFLASPDAMAKRLGARETENPPRWHSFCDTRTRRIGRPAGSVLDAIYATFTEGWSDPDDADLLRRDLADEALFLARLLTDLMPQEPEAFGLLACMLYAEARRRARRNAQGDYVPLGEQDMSLWDACMIDEAEMRLRNAATFGHVGRYQLEAALQSAHVERRRSGRTHWIPEVQLYHAPVCLDRFARRCAQSRAGYRRIGRAARRAGYCRYLVGRPTARGVSTVLGRTSGFADQGRQPTAGAPCL